MNPGGSSGSGAPNSSGSGDRPPFLLVVSITLTGIMGSTIVVPVIPDVARELGGGTAGIGLLVGAASAPGIVLAPIIGILADRFGRREVVVPCLVIFGLAGGLASLAPTFGVILALRLLQGVGSAGLINLAVTIIGDHWDGEDRTRMIGRNAASLTAAIVIAPPLGGLLGSIGGWRLAFAPLWLALVPAAVVAARLPRTRRQPSTVREQLAASAPFLRSPQVVGAMVAGFVTFILVFGVVLTALPAYLADEFNASPALRGLVLGTPALTSTATALLLARLVARVGTRGVVATAAALLAVAYLLLAAVPTWPAVFAAALIYGAGEGVIIPVLQNTVAGAAPASSRGSVVALFVGSVRSGQTIGPVLAAQGLASAGARPTFAIAAVIACALSLSTRALVRPTPAPAPAEAVVLAHQDEV